MPLSRVFSLRRHGVQSPSISPHDFSPNGASTTIIQCTLPDPPTVPQPLYPDYLNKTADPGWDAALAVASILEDIPAVPFVLISPLMQVLDVVLGIDDAVKKMCNGKYACAHLIF
jgi:hypothetical protein